MFVWIHRAREKRCLSSSMYEYYAINLMAYIYYISFNIYKYKYL